MGIQNALMCISVEKNDMSCKKNPIHQFYVDLVKLKLDPDRALVRTWSLEYSMLIKKYRTGWTEWKKYNDLLKGGFYRKYK